MKTKDVREKLFKVSGRLQLSNAKVAELLSVPRTSLSSSRRPAVLRVEKLLYLARQLQLDPEVFFSDMPIEIAEMASHEEIERKLEQARCELAVQRVLHICQEKGKTIYDFALRYDRLIRDEKTGYLKMTVEKLVSLSDGLSVDPRVLLFGDAFQPVPYPITEAMLELLREIINLRKKVYFLMSDGSGGIL